MVSFFLILFLASPSLTRAHKLGCGSGHHHDHHCDHDAEVRLSPEQPLSQEELKRVIHGSHEVLEGDHSASFLKRWVGAFDFKNKFIDSYRWGSAKAKDPRFKNVVTDSLLLFGFSHLLEMSTGPVLLTVGAGNEWPDWLMVTIGAGGAAISIPGFDPMCILIFGAYAKSEKFRGAVGTVRAALVKPLNKAWSFLGMSETLTALLRSREVSQLQGFTKMENNGDGQSTFYFSYPLENPIVDLEIKNDVSGIFIHSVTIHKNSLVNLNMSALKEWLKPLNWNAKNLIGKVIELSAQEKDLYSEFNKLYVKSVKQGRETNRVELVKHSVAIRAESCADHLK